MIPTAEYHDAKAEEFEAWADAQIENVEPYAPELRRLIREIAASHRRQAANIRMIDRAKAEVLARKAISQQTLN